MEGACIGIDLGTTNSVVAGVVEGKVHVFTDTDGHRLHPSVVAFLPNGKRVAGLRARMRRIIDAKNTVHSAKRIIGQPFRAPAVAETLAGLPYLVEEGPNQQPMVVTRAGRHTVSEIAGFILEHLKAIAEHNLGQPVSDCVITVPANFSDSQREATRQAAQLAGLNALRILNEPTAAALAYGHGRELNQRIAVFDYGGGTFDVTVLAVHGDVFEVITTGGDPFLGGDDMDRALALHLSSSFLQQHRVDLGADPQAWGKLLVIAEQVKMRLTGTEFIDDQVAEIDGAGGVALPLDIRLARDEFDSLIESFVDRALERTRWVLEQAELSPGSVDEVVLAGGATKIPLVQRKVAEFFGHEAQAGLDPMEVVALGAAVHAHNLTGESSSPRTLLMDVTSHPLGIATTGGYAECIIPKNTQIPAEALRVFTTARDGQDRVTIRVCQGDAARFDDNVEIGRLELSQLRTGSRGQVQIEVSFLVDADGICSVFATDVNTGETAEATLRLLGLAGEQEVG